MKAVIWVLGMFFALDASGSSLVTCETDLVRFREDSSFQYRYSLSYVASEGEVPKLVSTNFQETQIYYNNRRIPVLETYRRSLSGIDEIGPGEFKVHLGRGPEDVNTENGWIEMDAFNRKMVVRLPWISDPYTGEVLKFKEFVGSDCSVKEG